MRWVDHEGCSSIALWGLSHPPIFGRQQKSPTEASHGASCSMAGLRIALAWLSWTGRHPWPDRKIGPLALGLKTAGEMRGKGRRAEMIRSVVPTQDETSDLPSSETVWPWN